MELLQVVENRFMEMVVRIVDSSDLIRWVHSKDPKVDSYTRMLCWNELLRRGFKE
jgi:hypothetical protein